MKKLILFLGVITFLSGCNQAQQATQQPTAEQIPAAESAQSETERLNQWFEEKYEESLQASPLLMTFLGRKDRYDEFDDFTEEFEKQQLQWQADTVAELKSNFDYDKLDEDAKISYDLWIYQYEVAKANEPFTRRGYVFHQMSGIQAFLPSFMVNFHKVTEASDMQAYIKRLGGISVGILQLLERAKIHAAEGVRPPYFAYEGVIREAKAQLAGQPFVADSEVDAPLWADTNNKIEALLKAEEIDEATAAKFKASAKQMLIDEFQPAYSEVIAWFESDFANVSEQAKGMGALPEGMEAYNAALFNMTTTRLTSDEIHNTGLSEVKRLHSEMVKVMKEVGFEGTLQEFFVHIKTSKSERFYYPNTDEGRQGYINDSIAYLDFINEKLPEYFGILPKADLVVKRVEPFREQPGAAQHYFPGTPDGERPGTYYAHLSDMSLMPKNEMEAIAYHEGNPGHHMQLSIAQELESVPTFRTQARFTAYTEGWALYAEQLAYEMGAYTDPYSQYGRLASELWRAVRLVVDTGIHAKGWTEQQAIDYAMKNTSYPEGQIQSEIRRYFVLPGQATSYKIGMMKILELREKAKTELGDNFDIRGFHDVVLGGGAVPMSVLEIMVDSWITKQKSA